MPATARRSKSEAYEKGIREGAAMARRSRNMEPPEEEEEEEEEEMDMALQPGHSRKRSAKGAKNTKPAADGYGTKRPMDAECGCSGKKGGKCDGSCDSTRKRSDALTPIEYLTACELGIQDRSRSYIRARLDATERLDLKCGKGSISEGEKCTKGAATKVQPNKYANYAPSKITLRGEETGILSRKRIQREGFAGAAYGGDPFSRKEQAKRVAAVNASIVGGIGAVRGYQMGGLGGALVGGLAGAAYGGAVGALQGANSAQRNRATSNAARISLERQKFEKPRVARFKAQRAKMVEAGASRSELREQDMKNAMTLAKGYDRIYKRNRGRYGDSIYAQGFTPDMDQLDI